MTDADMKKLDLDYTVERAINALRARSHDLASLAEKLAKRADEIDNYKAEDRRLANRDDLFNWAINDIENMIRNLNFADMARIGGELHRVS